MKKVKVESLNMEISRGSQDINFKELLEGYGHKLMICIKSDSYDSQCYARISVWSVAETKWNVLYSIHYGSMKTEAKLYYLPNRSGERFDFFKVDRETLLKRAAEVLG